MDISWDNIYLAIQIVITIQLLLGILLNILEFTKRNILLAYLCFLIVYTYNIFFIYPFSVNPFLIKPLHLMGSYIYFGPILFLYLKSLDKTFNLNGKYLLKHLILPSSICIIYNFTNFKTYSLFIYPFLIGYFYLSFDLYKQILKNLKGYLKTRFKWFYGITALFIILDTPMLLIEDLATLNISFFAKIYPTTNNLFYQYLHFPLLFIHFFIISLYAITEISRFKNYFISKSLKQVGVSNDEIPELKEKLTSLFEENNIYRNPNLSLSDLSKALNIDKSIVSKFIKETYSKGFNDFINDYRVKDFKQLINEQKYSNYDLVGLAKESGFKSKATFYRVFKELEGITPNMYKKQLKTPQ